VSMFNVRQTDRGALRIVIPFTTPGAQKHKT